MLSFRLPAPTVSATGGAWRSFILVPDVDKNRRFFWCLASGRGAHCWVDIATSPSPHSDLSVVLRSLRGALGGWCARRVLGHVLVFLLYARLSDICLRMERLAARFMAGRLGLVGARMSVGRVTLREAADVARIWPRQFGWLVRLAGYEAAGFGSQLREILQTPAMMALLAASPQAARLLRPVCRMLAVETSLLQPFAAAAAGSETTAKVSRVIRRRIRESADPDRVPYRVPLPRGVAAAARRQGVGRPNLNDGD